MIKITKNDFSLDEVIQNLKQQNTGGVVIFQGVVRGESNGKRVDQMSIEVYEEMAITQLEDIRMEAMEKFPVQDIVIIHRYGDLQVGDNIVLIVIVAAHRASAFDACKYCIDELKVRVPIWKKEYTEDGEVWVEGERHE
jgi:molybdopterin synthase catalytic subunit